MLLYVFLRQGAALLLGVVLLLLAPSLIAAQSNSKPGCPNKCGNLTIPYPFGLKGQDDCYLTDDIRAFTIDCNTTVDPPIPYLRNVSTHIQVTDISVANHEMRIMVHVAHDCYNTTGRERRDGHHLSLGRTKFPISSTKNTFTAIGCDTKAYFEGYKDDNYAMGCMSLCYDITDVANDTCSGIGCCQASIPKNVFRYNISLDSFHNHSQVLGFNPCSYAFAAEKGHFDFSTNYLSQMNETMVPLVLDWAISNQTCVEAKRNKTSYVCKENTNCTDAENGFGYRCHCKEGFQGNPYLSGPDGCRDIDECKISNPCTKKASCINLNGSFSCRCPHWYRGDGKRSGTGCTAKVTSRDIALVVGMGCLLLLLCASWLALGVRHRKATKEREKFFKDNGGLLLQRLISQQSHVEVLKVFTAEELMKATDNFHESRILGQGGQSTVYKGTVMNNRIVAIKKAKLLDKSQVKDFINEIIILSQINHKNVVKLIGCCLEMEIPLLVYEFVSNGTLSDHLHGNRHCPTSLPTWVARLRVAAEIAGALSYLHSDVAIPIFHRDVKSTNILLDDNYIAKVSDFGASRLIPVDQTQLSTLVQGTFGYIDPEYFYTSQLTEKSDVYSFGVVLAELVTGIKAVSFHKPENERNLSLFFVTAVKEDRCMEVIDKRISNEGNADHIGEVALLASRCLEVKGDDRPSMKEVALELEGLLKVIDSHPWIHQNSGTLHETEFLLGESQMSFVDSGPFSTTVSNDTIKNQLLPFHVADAR